MTPKELLEKRAQLVAEARQIVDRADKEDRELTGEESANFDKYMSEADTLLERSERATRLESAEKSLQDVEPVISEPDPISDDAPEPRTDRSEQEMRAFRNFIQYGNRSNWPDNEIRALQADLDVSGGYTVAPPQFVNQLIKFVDNELFFRQLANIIPVTSSDAITAPSLDTDPADAAWTAEIGAVSEDSSMAFGARELEPHQLTKLLKVSEKLLMVSALPVENLVRDRLAYKLAVPQENAFLNGTGAGQPLGVFTASSQGISTSRDVSTDNSTAAFTFDGLKNAKYSLKSQYWPRLNWIFHRDGVKMAAKLKDGEGQYQWSPSTQAGDPDRLLGFPVRMSEYAPNTFTSGLYVGILGDFSHYWIAELQSMGFKRLDELYAANSQVGFRVKAWIDGMPVLEEAFARVKLG